MPNENEDHPPHRDCLEEENGIRAELITQALSDAQQELAEVPAYAAEDGLEPPARIALDNTKRLLQEMCHISPRHYGVYPTPDGYIAIDARGANDSIVVVLCGSDGTAFCYATINGESRRARYSTARELPDGFIREALMALGPET